MGEDGVWAERAGMARGIPLTSRDVESIRLGLAGVDVAALTDRQRIDLVAELEGLKGAATALQAVAVDAVRRSREETHPKDVRRSVGSEVALARRESPSCGDRFVRVARALVHEMPETMAALRRGVCGEGHAVKVVQASSVLRPDDRAELDRRLGPLLEGLGVKGADRAARRVAAELDAAAVLRRMEAAVASRRVTVRASVDGMGYLTVLGPMVEIAGAHAALLTRARSVVSGHCDDEPHAGRAVGPVMADTALAVLSGRAVGQVQPVEVHLVMTDRALLGEGDPSRDVMEPAQVPGLGPVPAPMARWWLRGAGEGAVWVRRLFSGPDGRDLVAMDSRRRLFTGLLRRMLVLRDDLCTTPWCESAIAHADHGHPAREGGPTDFETGNGTCARCNLTREAPRWVRRVTRTGSDPGRPREASDGRRVLEIRTPTGRTYSSTPPPILGWGTGETPDVRPGAGAQADARGRDRNEPGTGGWPTGPRRRARRRHRHTGRPPKRPLRVTSRLERALCRSLT